MFELRDYQLKAKNETYSSIKEGFRRVINWIQTGGGKGLLMADYAHDALSVGKKVLVVMRRRDLIFQTRDNFKKYKNINASIIMGKEPGYDKNKKIQICSIDTLRNAIKKEEFSYLANFDVIQIDECHDSTSPTYQRLLDFLGDKTYIGFTATPYAIGNKPLLFWDKTIKPINPSEIRDAGFLVPDRFFRPGVIDTSGLKKMNGDYSIKDLFEVVTDLKIIGDAVDAYNKYGDNRPFLGFCVNKAHSKLMAHAFSEAGIPAIHIDESHNKQEREKAKLDLESGKIKGIFNVNIFSTGWDCPMVSVMIGLRPTLSEILAIQQWGRVLRIHPGKKDAIILDHANNSSRFGFPYDDNRVACLTEYALEFKKKEERKDELKVKDCPECDRTIEANANECPFCGFKFVANGRDVEHESGELHEVDQSAEKHVDKNFEKIKKHLNSLTDKEKMRGWKPVAKYFMLYDKFGSDVSNYMEELGIPKWIDSTVKKNNNIIACKNCSYFRFGSVHLFNSRFVEYGSKLKAKDIGYCTRFDGDDVKSNFYCIKFKNKRG